MLRKSRWGPPDGPALDRRRGEILSAVQRIRRRSFDLKTGTSDLRLLAELTGIDNGNLVMQLFKGPEADAGPEVPWQFTTGK